MKTLVRVGLLQLCVFAAAVGPGSGSTDRLLAAESGDFVLLPCYTAGNVTPSTTWIKNGREVIGGAAAQRLRVLKNGSLSIGSVAPEDEGSYLCNYTLPGGTTFQARVQLQVTSGPANVSTSIGPATTQSNGTVVVIRGSTVHFNCSGSSYPSQRLTWAFRGASSSNDSLVSASGSRLDFRIDDIQPSSQGVYSCMANNTVSRQTVNKSTELLVYYVTDRPAECLSVEPQDLSQLQLTCAWSGAYPTPKLRWEADRVYTTNLTDRLLLTLTQSKLSNGQMLRCMAQHPALAPGKEKLCSFTLNVSDRHPDCMWAPARGPSQLQVTCSWVGVFPAPKLRWEGDLGQQTATWNVSALTNNLTVTLNQSQLLDKHTVKCVAEHILLAPGEEKSCSLPLKSPYPEGEPLATAVEGSSMTLTCTELTSSPPANTTWRKGTQQKEIIPGSKYIVSVETATVKLTILNVSKEDEGFYFCRSENPLGVVVLEVCLTVKASSVNTGAVIGVFVAVLIIVATFAIAKTLYSQRHQICLGGGFGQLGDRGDVFNLVESDDEQVFQDAVPQLPPVTNGRHTTLVEIHRMPSSDHEDPETNDTINPQQLEDTAETEEPEDLVSY